MQKNINLKLLPEEASSDIVIREYIATLEGNKADEISGYTITKKSIDARGKQVWINLTLKIYINEPVQQREKYKFNFQNVRKSDRSTIIIGAGPAGLFAALKLIELGIKPIILERGKEVRTRRRDLAILNKEGIINPDSNYCFGEGGAGTYSDGKLYTRSSKRGNINRILQLFVHFGAEEKILYEAHPHIGTNKLPHIISAMRMMILECGGEINFEKKVSDFNIRNNKIASVTTQCRNTFTADNFILATGHSARDIFELLHQKRILIEAKPFALGVRVEHPQFLIDSSQYHCTMRSPHLPPASYSLVQQINGKGVFSFCMCPGGIIAPASTSPGELVVNGWSPSKRNNPYANSGIVVAIEEKDWQNNKKLGPLAAMKYQQDVEVMAFKYGGGKFVAPAQRMVDFFENKISNSLPACSYLPGLQSAALKEVLPAFVYQNLQIAFKEYGKKMKGYFSNDAVVVATESRTSSPVRIPRDKLTLQHPQINNLYPCGEGAGYAGGIVSAAMDGENVATQIATFFS
ncbi:MAG TPA: FAD-dependent monooxygenase [Chitinophagaceae bacterium]|jgi:uncharacterized FAD-dependent dehydrogenase|nr:FAD-dependent monooxygenase [Chitinophagaceae bacterium]